MLGDDSGSEGEILAEKTYTSPVGRRGHPEYERFIGRSRISVDLWRKPHKQIFIVNRKEHGAYNSHGKMVVAVRRYVSLDQHPFARCLQLIRAIIT